MRGSVAVSLMHRKHRDREVGSVESRGKAPFVDSDVSLCGRLRSRSKSNTEHLFGESICGIESWRGKSAHERSLSVSDVLRNLTSVE